MKFFIFADSVFPDINASVGKIGTPFLEANWHWLLIGLLVLIAVGIIVYLAFPKPKPLTPYQKAKLDLEKLSLSDLEDEPFANKLSDIIRVYLEEEYHLPAPERTTEEFLVVASNSNSLPENARAGLEKLLKLSDMAKFAKYAFDENQQAEILSVAYDFVEIGNAENKKNEEEKNTLNDNNSNDSKLNSANDEIEKELK